MRNAVMSEPNFRAGHVAIVGRPNVGKSTLVNALVGRKVTIVTAKPQTTRHRILGLVNRPEAQLVLVDTPGLHESTRRVMNQYMNRVAISSSQDADVILFVIEAMRFTEEDVWVWERVRGLKQPLFLVVNKVDRVFPKEQAAALSGGDDHARARPRESSQFRRCSRIISIVWSIWSARACRYRRRCSPRMCSPTATSRSMRLKSCARS